MSSSGLYVGFEPKPERIEQGARITTCKRCGKLTGHKPLDSVGHEIICLSCAHDVPAIQRGIIYLTPETGSGRYLLVMGISL